MARHELSWTSSRGLWTLRPAPDRVRWQCEPPLPTHASAESEAQLKPRLQRRELDLAAGHVTCRVY
eukprot:552140-Rhodomonas_salina.1